MMWDKLNVNLDILRRLVDSGKLSEEESRTVNDAILFITKIRNESKSFAKNIEYNIIDNLYLNEQLIIDYAKDALKYHDCAKDALKYIEDKLVILTKRDFDHLEYPGEYILYYCSDIEKIYVLIPGEITITVDTDPSLIDKWKRIDRIP